MAPFDNGMGVSSSFESCACISFCISCYWPPLPNIVRGKLPKAPKFEKHAHSKKNKLPVKSLQEFMSGRNEGDQKLPNLRIKCSSVVKLETPIITTVVAGKQKRSQIQETINPQSYISPAKCSHPWPFPHSPVIAIWIFFYSM